MKINHAYAQHLAENLEDTLEAAARNLRLARRLLTELEKENGATVVVPNEILHEYLIDLKIPDLATRCSVLGSFLEMQIRRIQEDRIVVPERVA